METQEFTGLMAAAIVLLAIGVMCLVMWWAIKWLGFCDPEADYVWDDGEDTPIDTKLLRHIVWIPIVLCAVGGGLGIASLCGDYNYTCNEVIYNIASLHRIETAQGAFFLGSGFASGTEYYYMYKIESPSLYSLEKLEASRCKIAEDDGTPCVWKVKNVGWEKHHYVIHVPVGTVVVEYSA